MTDRVINGIFSREDLKDNQAEFCIVSDVHIANDKTDKKEARNDYIFNDKGEPLSGEAYTLKRFCDKIKLSGDRGHFRDGQHIFILLGDIINGGECGYFNCYNSYAYKLLYNSIEPWLYTGNILYISGNHDKEAKFYSNINKFPRKSVIETINPASKKDNTFIKCGVMFEHGNKFDYLCSGKNFIGLMGDFASNFVVSICSPDLEDLLRGRSYYIDHSSDNEARIIPEDVTIKSMNLECSRIANGAFNAVSKNNECHTIVCGHTHQSPVKISTDVNKRKITYYNTGKFSRDGYLNIVVEKDSSGRWSLSE